MPAQGQSLAVFEQAARTLLHDQIIALGATQDVANACCHLFSSLQEARPFVGRPEDRDNGFKPAWQEYYSQRYQRYYYVNRNSSENIWDLPPPMQLRDCMLDAEMYGVDIAVCRLLQKALLTVVNNGGLWPTEGTPSPSGEALRLMSRMVGNIVACDNSVEKFRQVKTDNPAFLTKVAGVPGAVEVLQLAGFSISPGFLTFPSTTTQPTDRSSSNAPQSMTTPGTAAAADTDTGSAAASGIGSNGVHVSSSTSSNGMSGGSGSSGMQADPLLLTRMVAAKLSQLSDLRGFTGSATSVDDVTGSSGGGSGSSSSAAVTTARHSGKPGFRFQTEIFECGACHTPINDGSERLFSGSHDSPKGSFRYECCNCTPAGAFNLCEACWDRRTAGQNLHDSAHTFRPHHPRASRHFMFSTESSANPWGNFSGGGISGRSYQRLMERTGFR